jgi:hypothetical protein
VWNDTYGAANSGCSAYETKPSWQADAGCTTRTVADVAAVADPQTGVAVYDTYANSASGWQPGPVGNGLGGEGVAAAIIAGVYALAGTPGSSGYPAAYPYQHPGGSYTLPGNAYPYADGFNNITSGSNGTCSPSYLCTAGAGYSGPTGVGSPSTSAAFSATGTLTGPLYGGITGLCLDDSNNSTADGNKIQIWNCNGDAAQQWTAYSDGTVRVQGSHCLDVANGGTADGTKIQLWSCINGDANQQWLPVEDDSLYNPRSGKCIDDPGGTTTEGTQLEIYDCDLANSQVWPLPYTAPSTTGIITSQVSRGKCVDDFNGSASNNNKIDIWDCNGNTSAQTWTAAPDGTLQIHGMCLVTQNDGTSNGTPIVLYGCTGDTNQHWIARSDGTLVNRRSGTCLDDPNAVLTNGTQLQISTCDGLIQQNWKLP